MKQRFLQSSSKNSSYSLLRNQVTLSGMNRQKIQQFLSDFMAHTPDKFFAEQFFQLLALRPIQNAIPSFFQKITDFTENGFVTEIPTDRLIEIYLVLIAFQREKLVTFVTLREQIECAVLFSDLHGALKLLDLLEAQIGESIWHSRTKMLVLSGLGDTTSFEQYCKYCELKTNGSFNSFIFKCSQLIADSGNATLQLNTVVDRNVSELNEAKRGYLASFLQVLFSPFPLTKIVDPLESLLYIQTYPVVDQYSLLTTILRYEICKETTQPLQRSKLVKIAAKLASLVPDTTTTRLAKVDSATNDGTAVNHSPILQHYSSGDYPVALEEFLNPQARTVQALGVVNIGAKSMAYMDLESTLDRRTPPIINIANSLATIYRLSPLWSQAEEQLLSLCIKHNHFTYAPHIQVALFKALPFRYESNQQERAAKIAISSATFCTPQTYSLAGLTLVMQNDMSSLEQMPRYRQLKQQVFESISKKSNNLSDLNNHIEEISKTNMLLKDILECRAHYFLSTEQHEVLLKDTATNLVIDSNRFVCFPMEELLNRIEKERRDDLDSIIIAYHYNKSISDERDYILNEAFSSYLTKEKVNRPSDLLRKKSKLEPMEMVFFRDICVPDVMDYLDCFQTSNDLRSERILILDSLASRGDLDAKSRMREVEDIVRQVIVDAGTSEFNGAKIFVNDLAIKKKHYEEVTSLLALYKRIPREPGERYTRISSDGTKGGYISGNRSSLVERLYNMLFHSFLFDDKYGLDKNLSADIRHGFFSNLMRARLEEWHLLTELDEEGNYLPNQHWREHNSLIREEFWVRIDELLKSFSRKFDNTVAQAEEWMKVKLRPGVEAGMFVFELSVNEFAELQAIVEATEEADFIVSQVLDLLWSKTETALSLLRERINGEFKMQIDRLFDETICEISETKGTIPLLDLMNAFTRARNEIKDDISTASDWFNRSDNTEISAGSLDRLIEIAVRSFEKVRGNAYSINIVNTAKLNGVLVNKNVAKPFILAIINLLDNCYVHSGLGHATRVEITGNIEGSLATVTIKNSLSGSKQIQLSAEQLEFIRAKLAASDISKHIRGEGGTGLIKARNEITYLGKQSLLSICRNDGCFDASITYDYRAAI